MSCPDETLMESTVLGWMNEENDEVQRDQRKVPLAGTAWYLINKEFLENWKGGARGIEIDNSGLLEDSEETLKVQNEVVVRKGLTLGRDYEVVCKKVWKYFCARFPVNFKVKRFSIQLNALDTYVEVTYKPVSVAIVNEDGAYEYQAPRTLYLPHKGTVEDLKRKVLKLLRKQAHTDDIRVFKVLPESSYGLVKELTFRDLHALPVTFLDEDSVELVDACVADTDVLIVELQSHDGGWKIEPATHLGTIKCHDCQKVKKFGVNCECGLYEFCSSAHREHSHHTCHKHNGNSFSTFKSHEPPRKGLVGLQNLGNTCFMNSGLQCLSNSKFLTEFLLSGNYKADLNLRNPLGTGGQLLREYVNLVQHLWEGTNSVMSPWEFKKALGKFAHQFSGFEQHDSQEMLSFLLDGIHEDLNRVQEKPATTDPRTEGLSEIEIAHEFWKTHLQRNQSVIVDNMHGQYRSEITCPRCNEISLVFDPFLMVTLSIPAKQRTVVEVTYIPLDPVQKPLKMKLEVDKKRRVRDVKREVARTLNLAEDELFLAHLLNSSVYNCVYEDDEKCKKWGGVYAFQCGEPPENYINVAVELYKEPIYNTYYSNDKVPLTFPRLFAVNVEWDLEQLYREVFRHFARVLHIDEECFEEAVKVHFPTFFQEPGDNAMKLRFHNPNKNYSFYTKKEPCPFCDQLLCTNCEVPYKQTPFAEYLNKNKGNMKLEIIWSKAIPSAALANFSKIENHPSNRDFFAAKDEAPLSIYDCLTHSAIPEQLDEFNTSYCRTCKEHVQVVKKMDIYRLPRVLMFHIKRFKQSRYFSSRNDRLVEFPIENLAMNDFCLTGGGVYDLYAVSNHYGSISFGHYTAFARNSVDHNWYDFDDSRVSRVSDMSDIVSTAAYILFYVLRE